MIRRALTLVAVNLAVFGVLAEVAGVGLYYVDTGALFYTHTRRVPRLVDSRDGRLTLDALHPYFGPTHQPGAPFEIPEQLGGANPAAAPQTNNFGFLSRHEYPFRRTSDRQFIVGLFGGSVGAWFCQLGASRLVENLQRTPFFRDREIIPLCFSHEGYKQPQQLLVLAYFLSIGQPLDLVVNLDGFNEVALGSLNDQRGFDISMPSAQHMESLLNVIDQSTLTPEKLRLLASIAAGRDELNGLAARMEQAAFAVQHLVLARRYERLQTDYVRDLGRFSNLPSNARDRSIIRVTPDVAARDGAQVFADAARGWAEGSRLMWQMLSSRRIPYVHLLQPNQYHTGRRFAAEEARVALAQDSPFKAAVEQGYPELRRQGAALARELPFTDATGAFDGVAAAVYMDNCCHYSKAGNERIADVIAGAVLATAGPWSDGSWPR